MTVEELLYIVVALAALGGVCDVAVLLIAFQMRREARAERATASRYLDMAAEHGKTTDNVVERAVSELSSKSGEIVLANKLGPTPPPPQRPSGRGCGTVVPVVVALAVVGAVALEGADAGAAMRRDGEVRALAWWAGQPPGSLR